jgi:hypothetical protein
VIAPPLPNGSESLLCIPTTSLKVSPVCVFGCSCHDVDNTVHRVVTPDGSARTSHNFDSLDVFQDQPLSIPEDATKQAATAGRLHAKSFAEQDFV